MSLVLLRPHLLTFKNRLFPPDGSKQHLQRDLLLLFVAFLVMGCIFFILTFTMKRLEHDPLFRTFVPTKIIELMSYAFFILLLLSNTIAAIGGIFSSENLNVALSAPVTNFKLYCAKVIEILFETTSMLLVFVLPTALAYSYCLEVKDGFLLFGALCLIPFVLIPVGLGIALATIVVRIVALVWRRGAILLVVICGASAWVITELVQFLTYIKVQRGGTQALVQMIGFFDNPNPNWLPSRWLADILSSFLGPNLEDPLLKVGLLVSAAFGSLALGYLCFDADLLGARGAALALGRGRKHRSDRREGNDPFRGVLETVYHMIPIEQQTRAMILKDLSSLVRDQAQAVQLLLYVGIASVYVITLRLLGGLMSFTPVALKAWTATLASMNILIAGFVITAMMTRLVYPAVSLEGRAFWIMQITPIGIRKMINAKFWCWFPIVSFLSVALLLAGALAIDLPKEALLCTIVIGVCFSFGCTGIAIGIGSVFASFDWESPSQISASLGTLMLLLVGIAFVLVLSVPSAIVTFFVAIPELATRFGAGYALLATGLSLFLIILTNLFASIWACRIGTDSLLARQRR